MNYRLEDYVINAKELSIENVYNWEIDGEIYSGTVKDFIESTYKKGVTYSFKCNRCGHISSKSHISICNGGLYCAKCSRVTGRLRKPISLNDSLYGMYPVVADWFDKAENKVSSKDVRAHSNFEYFFKCPTCGEVFKKQVNAVVQSYTKHNSSSCGVCAGYLIREGYNDITAKNPPSAKYWDEEKNGIPCTKVIWSDQNYRWFKCPLGHSYRRTPFRMLNSYNKGIDGRGLCPICTGREVQEGYNDLKSKNPLALKYWDYDKNKYKPEEVYFRSHKQYWFRCDEGHSFLKRPNEFWLQTTNEYKIIEGCPVCSGKRFAEGINDLQTKHSELVEKYWDYNKNEVSPNKVFTCSGKEYWWKCTRCGKSFLIDNDRRVKGLGLCEDCRVYKSVSSFEVDVYNEVIKIFPEAQTQVEIEGMFYDIYIPERNLVIECNGVYWHSDAVSRYRDGRHNLNKLNILKNKGVSLFVIWEDSWVLNRGLVLKTLFRKLGKSTECKVNARDCVVVEESNTVGIISKNHLQGEPGIGCKYIALENKGNVVAELAYKYDEKGIYIVRYATNCIVRGGFSKVLSYIKKNICVIGSIIYTFSDNSISNGDLYKLCGFQAVDILKPDYMYVYKNVRYHKFNFRKSRFLKDPELSYEDNLTEKELASLNKIYRVYDYGKVRWELLVD